MSSLLANRDQSDQLNMIVQKSKLSLEELTALYKIVSVKPEDLLPVQTQQILEVKKLLDDEDEFLDISNCINEKINQAELHEVCDDDTNNDNENDMSKENNLFTSKNDSSS